MSKVREWVERNRAAFLRAAHLCEAVSLVLLIAVGGGVAGYSIALWQAREAMIEQRADHLAEIERMQETYGITLRALVPKINDIAQTASEAAGAAAEAAVTSAEVAQTAKRVAQGKASGPTPLTEAERAKANSAIEAANRKLREGVR
ncbi:hypothetical protein CURE108131_23255 [Cupriavidus respiraculi]|uniref:Uncharacterized protein n=1 Tax=Cupriavidus respiraculi TaxID=195930 RepID=A0ABN7YJP4_9BURK|nr:hypothetical protein [Cupriavidus respiraculi]CAG9172350.1 hypothetical protein LMG21510_01945 [Cupriavidus respiraculi]